MLHFVCHSSDEEEVLRLFGHDNVNASSSLDLEGPPDEVFFVNTSEDVDGIVDAWKKANDRRAPSSSSSELWPPISMSENDDAEEQRTTTRTKRDERHVKNIHFHLNLFCHRFLSRRFDCESTLVDRNHEEVLRDSSRRYISSI